PLPELLERVRRPRRHIQKVLIGDRSGVARLTFPVVGDLRRLPRLHMAVEAVLRDVELPAEEPFGIGRLPLEHPGERLAPDKGPRLLGPKALEVFLGPLIDAR